ncbi:hypothetical protein WB44_01225 [Synechococcus sp. WH 8020]|uniref:GmrSD restriction endonuclease domain-containing protein n=1 Tax=Synechococcus sp. (strain WH8020) TaxID=32052 RepID=UPI0006528346|nr:DUF262 domain-containing protein [Synechococcus sp. WH 8020]AKN59974.1 hypothetical protein WB44_01225 [Synechococcus sp. WH 8020]
MFDSTKRSLRELLQELRKGTIQLPEFQRGWVWKNEQIKELIASVIRQYPIGAVMLLEAGGEVRFQTRPVEGLHFQGQTPDPELLILDGQQRLTSMFQATLMGAAAKTENERKQKVERWYYLDMNRLLNNPDLLEEAVIDVPADRIRPDVAGRKGLDLSTSELEYELQLFPLSRIYEASSWQTGYVKYWKETEQFSEAFEVYTAFQDKVIAPFCEYQLPVITLAKSSRREAVCQVFEKVNTGGVKLNAFELVTASYAADGFDLRADWYGRKARDGDDAIEGRYQRFLAGREHGKTDGVQRLGKILKAVRETDFLQCVALLSTRQRRELDQQNSQLPIEKWTGISCKRATILDLPLSEYQQWADQAELGFFRAGRFLIQQGYYRSKDLPYVTQLVPLAAILSSLGDDYNAAATTQKVEQWYWCGVLGELYGGAIETRFGKDLPEVINWIEGKGVPSSVYDADFRPSRLDTMRTRNSAAYKGLYTLLLREQAKDFRTGRPIDDSIFYDDAIDIHHVFPAVWCEAQGIDTDMANSILNKTPLTARTNRVIGGAAPSIYLPKLEKAYLKHQGKGGDEVGNGRTEMDALLHSHSIHPEHLRRDAFEAFYEQRRRDLLELISRVIGKTIAVEGTQSLGEEGLPQLDEDDETTAALEEIDA